MFNRNILSRKMLLEIEKIIHKFPEGNKSSAVVEILIILQKQYNLDLNCELLNAVAEHLMISKMTVHELADFLHIVQSQEVSKYQITMCTSISCKLSGGKKISDYLKTKLNLDFDKTTDDCKFSLKEGACMANCQQGPIVKINQQKFKQVSLEMLAQIIENLT